MDRIERMLKGVTSDRLGPAEDRRLYSQVAAEPKASKIVRVQLNETVDLTAEERFDTDKVLDICRKDMPSAVGVHILKSGAVDVHFRTIADKDKSALQGTGSATTTVRRDYLLEIMGVHRSVGVAHGKNADNVQVLGNITMGAQRLCPGLKIYSVAKKDEPRQYERVSGLSTLSKRAAFILGFNSTEHRDMVIQRGIVIRGEIY